MDSSVAAFNGVPSSRVVGAFHVNVALPPPVTVSAVAPETLPDAARIVVDPAATDVARPLEPAALLIVATAVLEELQVAVVVRFCVVPSE
jgi:hypothetical protein